EEIAAAKDVRVVRDAHRSHLSEFRGMACSDHTLTERRKQLSPVEPRPVRAGLQTRKPRPYGPGLNASQDDASPDLWSSARPTARRCSPLRGPPAYRSADDRRPLSRSARCDRSVALS